MHAKGLIHRDLKLENLLLDKHRNVIISDFGFVNSYNRDKNDLMKTSCGSPVMLHPNWCYHKLHTKEEKWISGHWG